MSYLFDAECKRQHGGGSVLIWGAIGFNGRSEFVLISGKMNADKYVQLLEQQISDGLMTITDASPIFQQDNVSVMKLITAGLDRNAGCRAK